MHSPRASLRRAYVALQFLRDAGNASCPSVPGYDANLNQDNAEANYLQGLYNVFNLTEVRSQTQLQSKLGKQLSVGLRL